MHFLCAELHQPRSEALQWWGCEILEQLALHLPDPLAQQGPWIREQQGSRLTYRKVEDDNE